MSRQLVSVVHRISGFQHIDSWPTTSKQRSIPKQLNDHSQSEEAGRLTCVQDLVIRRASEGDAAKIAAISAAVNVRTFASLGQGFLVYTLDESEYLRRIGDCQHLFVFEIETNVVGFVCGYEPEKLTLYLSDGTLAHESDIGRGILQAAKKKGSTRYAFLDSIALAPEYQQQGLGERAFDSVCEAIPLPFFAAMLEAPIRNPRIDYWQRRGFIRVSEVLQPTSERFRILDPVNNDVPQLKWGIYYLPFGGFYLQRARMVKEKVCHE